VLDGGLTSQLYHVWATGYVSLAMRLVYTDSLLYKTQSNVETQLKFGGI